MTLAEWMGQNGYSEYNSAAGRRELQKKYGINNTNSAAANLELWKKLKAEKAQPKKTEVENSSIPQELQAAISEIQELGYVPEQYQQLIPVIGGYMPEIYDYEGSEQYQGSGIGDKNKIGELRKKAESEKDKQLKDYYAQDNVIKYFTNREASRTEVYQNRLEEALKYLPADVASKVRYMNNMGTEEDEIAAKNRNYQKELNQAQYDFAQMAAQGLFSTKHGNADAFYDQERAAVELTNMLNRRPELKEALEKSGMTPEQFLQQLESTYAKHTQYGNKVTENAHVNKANKEAVQRANDQAMTGWMQNGIRTATNNAAGVGASLVANATSMPAALIAHAVHNVRSDDANDESMGQFFDRQFGWGGSPRKLFGSEENAEWDSGSKFVNFVGNVVTDPMSYISAKLLSSNNLKLVASPTLYNAAATNVVDDAPMLGQKIFTETTNFVPKASRKVTTHGNYPRGQQVITATRAVPTYLGTMEKSISVPTVVGGIPGVSFTPGKAGSPIVATYTPTYLPPMKEEVKYVKDWGNEDVQEAFRQAAANGVEEGSIITGPSGKTYIYKKDPQFTGRITAVNPNALLAGGTNEPIIVETSNNITEVPNSVRTMRIPYGYQSVVTDNKDVSFTPTYNLGKQNLNYLTYSN